MRKLVTVFAALAVAGMAMAQAESQIVGYVTETISAKEMNIIGVHFQNTDDSSLNVQDILPDTGISAGTDLLRVWNPATGTYTSVYYFGDTYADFGYDPDLGPGWADGDQIRSNFSIEAGQSFWLATTKETSVTIAGEVLAATDNKVSTLAKTMNMISNTFPVDANIQNVTPISGISFGTDLLRIWDSAMGVYKSFYYFPDTYADFGYDPDLGAGWADGDQIRANIQIPVGSGFWLATDKATVLEFVAPAGI